MKIDLLHIPNLILNLCFYAIYFPYNGLNGFWSSKGNGKDKEFEYLYL
jgi:hypothetical protein